MVIFFEFPTALVMFPVPAPLMRISSPLVAEYNCLTSCPPMFVKVASVELTRCAVTATVLVFVICPAMPNTKLAITAAKITVIATISTVVKVLLQI